MWKYMYGNWRWVRKLLQMVAATNAKAKQRERKKGKCLSCAPLLEFAMTKGRERSLQTLARTFSNEAGLISEKQTRKTSCKKQTRKMSCTKNNRETVFCTNSITSHRVFAELSMKY